MVESTGLRNKSAARLYNRYVAKVDSLLPPNLQGLTETVDVPDLDPDDKAELKTFLSELLFNLGQLQSIIKSATGIPAEGARGKTEHRRWRHYPGHAPPHGVDRGRQHVHVETRLHRGPRTRAHPMPPVPPVPPMPPIPIISSMPGVPQEVREAWRSWAQELRNVHREWLQGLGQAHRDWYQNLGQAWGGTVTEEAAEDIEAREEAHQLRHEILAMVESRQITVEEAMTRLEALKAPGVPGTEPAKEGQP